MAQLDQNFVVDQNAEEQTFDLLPAGEYVAVIVDSDYVVNSKNTGMNLKLTYEIIEGVSKGRKVFENLSVRHENEKTQQIAKTALSAIGRAVGVNTIQDSNQLHRIPLKIKIKITPPKDGYPARNRIDKHEPLNGGSTQTGSAPAATGQPATQKSQPWKK